MYHRELVDKFSDTMRERRNMEDEIEFMQNACIEAILLCRDVSLLDLVWKLLIQLGLPISGTTSSKKRSRRRVSPG